MFKKWTTGQINALKNPWGVYGNVCLSYKMTPSCSNIFNMVEIMWNGLHSDVKKSINNTKCECFDYNTKCECFD